MQQHGSKYYARRPPPPDPGGQKVKIQLISEHSRIAFQIKGNRKCSNIVANISATAPPPSPDPGIERSNSTIAEHGHVAYLIKGNRECSNMVTHILPGAPPPPPPLPSEGQNSTFSEHCHGAHQRESRMQQQGSNCRQRYNKYEAYQTWFLIQGLCLTPWVDLGGGIKLSKFNLF